MRWKGIEATQEFATSPNTKIVLVGNGANDLPVILSATEPIPTSHPHNRCPANSWGYKGSRSSANSWNYKGSRSSANSCDYEHS